MVGQDHVVGNRNEERRNHVFGLAASSLGGQTVTAAIAAAGRPERKQENRQKLPASPLVRASNARRWSSVMLVVMAAVSRAVAQEDRSPALGFVPTPPDPDLLKAGCGYAATDAPGAADGKGMAWCIDHEPDRYSRCFVLPVKVLPMSG